MKKNILIIIYKSLLAIWLYLFYRPFLKFLLSLLYPMLILMCFKLLSMNSVCECVNEPESLIASAKKEVVTDYAIMKPFAKLAEYLMSESKIPDADKQIVVTDFSIMKPFERLSSGLKCETNFTTRSMGELNPIITFDQNVKLSSWYVNFRPFKWLSNFIMPEPSKPVVANIYTVVSTEGTIFDYKPILKPMTVGFPVMSADTFFEKHYISFYKNFMRLSFDIRPDQINPISILSNVQYVYDNLPSHFLSKTETELKDLNTPINVAIADVKNVIEKNAPSYRIMKALHFRVSISVANAINLMKERDNPNMIINLYYDLLEAAIVNEATP